MVRDEFSLASRRLIGRGRVRRLTRLLSPWREGHAISYHSLRIRSGRATCRERGAFGVSASAQLIERDSLQWACMCSRSKKRGLVAPAFLDHFSSWIGDARHCKRRVERASGETRGRGMGIATT